MLDESWVLAPDVALRPEPFGALAYHFGTRRLTFLKRRELLAVVEGLTAESSVRSALERACVPPEQWPAYIQALESLASTGMITRSPERKSA
jgi:putative mycofactocin binding protein MftB